jgi:hypothetical protein
MSFEILKTIVKPVYQYTDTTGRNGHEVGIVRTVFAEFDGRILLYQEKELVSTYTNDIYSQLRHPNQTVNLLGNCYDLNSFTEAQIKQIFNDNIFEIARIAEQEFVNYELSDIDEDDVIYGSNTIEVTRDIAEFIVSFSALRCAIFRTKLKENHKGGSNER